MKLLMQRHLDALNSSLAGLQNQTTRLQGPPGASPETTELVNVLFRCTAGDGDHVRGGAWYSRICPC